MNTALEHIRRPQPILSRQLEERLNSPAVPDETVRTTGLVAAMLEDAIRERASDVHIDRDIAGFQLRFRIDGVMVDTMRLGLADAERIIRACRSLAGLEPGPSRIPQDGRAEFNVDGKALAVRIAVAPTVLGEKMTLRMLVSHLPRLSLDQLGLSSMDYDLVSRVLQDARGMVLLSGPTGSGKTTTLYALLNELRPSGKVIVTVEDPVEHILDGITQIQVREKQGLTFSESARGLMRLDPDVILMGELRDAASARIALDIADTGHLFLSSLHARDAVATVTALRNFGLEDFEIAASVDMIIAQRLVRRLCLKCRKHEPPTAEESKWLQLFGQSVPKETWHARGCPECSMTGYRGRVGIFEVWRLHEEDSDLILKHADEHTLRRRLRREGMSSLLEDDLAKVTEGTTTIAEMQAVGGFGFYLPSVPANHGSRNAPLAPFPIQWTDGANLGRRNGKASTRT